MTKHELMKSYHILCEEKRIEINGIYSNSNKSEIENAIECLKCSDVELDDYMTVIKLKYPNTYKTISAVGNFRVHQYNRLYVYNTARLLLSQN